MIISHNTYYLPFRTNIILYQIYVRMKFRYLIFIYHGVCYKFSLCGCSQLFIIIVKYVILITYTSKIDRI